MKTAKLSDIHISPNRQRQEFELGALNELKESIEQRGLFHAVICRPGPEGLVLVAGERRLRAVQDIYDLGGTFNHDGTPVPAGEIPFVTLGDLSELEAEEAELEENIRRIDLTWQERAAATARLAALRGKQAVAAGQPEPTVAAVSVEVRGSAEGKHHETTRREMIVARHLDKPEVRAAKSVDEAFKLLRRQEQEQKNVELAAKVGATFGGDLHQAYQADAAEWMAGQAADSFDVILTDPPYGMGADEFGDSGGLAAGEHAYADSAEVVKQVMQWFPLLSYRAAKLEAHLYLFCDVDWFIPWRESLAAAGWKVFRTPLIWDKMNGQRAPWPEHGPRRNWEMCLYAMKGKRPVTRLYSDVVHYTADPNVGHSAQKPVALYKDLLQRSVRPGDTVLDPFAGSGTIFPAADALKCRATGIEQDPKFYALCVKRIEALKAQGELEGLL